MEELRFRMEEEDFEKLLSGEFVEKEVKGVKIKFFLADIGFDRIFDAVLKKYNDFLKGQK